MSANPVIDAAQAVADLLDRRSDPAARLTVDRTYAPDWLDPDAWKENPDLADRFLARHAFVFPAEGDLSLACRGQDYEDATVAVVLLERYDGAGEVPPNDWLDARVAWLRAEVVKVLADARGDPVPNAFAVVNARYKPYSPDLLRSLKLWRAEVTVTYRYEVDYSP